MARGRVPRQTTQVYFVDQEALIPEGHPIRRVKPMVDEVLRSMHRLFDGAYAPDGRLSIPPERLLKAMLLMALFSVRSERQVVEQLGYNLLFRWFLDMNPDEPVFDATTFTKNRERFEQAGITRAFFERIVALGIAQGLVSDEHFTVDGTLIASYASFKSLRPIESPDEKVSDGSDDGDGGNPSVNFRGERRSNATHRSLTDPQARLARKSQGGSTMLAHSAHALMENRHGLIVDFEVDQADGTAERRNALLMVKRVRRRHQLMVACLGADAGYDDGAFLAELEHQEVTPHVALRKGAIRLRSPQARARWRMRLRQRGIGYQLSQRKRKLVEEIFGWGKVVGGLRRARHAVRWKIRQCVEMIGAAYNLLRIARLRPEPS